MQHKPLIILSLALTLLISFDYLAAWTVPPSNPPSGNIAAPLNTSGTSQQKDGVLGVMSLNAALYGSGGGIVRAENQVRANQYCDLNGENCSADLTESIEGSGTNTIVPGWPDVITCPPTAAKGDNYVLYLERAPEENGRYRYMTPDGKAFVRFNPDGSFHQVDEAYGCNNLSTQDLMSAGHAYSTANLMTEGGPGGFFIKSRGQAADIVIAAAGLASGGMVYSSDATRAAVCELVLPGSSPISHKNHSYTSPSDNHVYNLDDSGTWYRRGASGYNRGIQTLYCR